MAKSAKFDLVKDYYKTGFWTEEQVRNAVEKGWISSKEFKEITGNIY